MSGTSKKPSRTTGNWNGNWRGGKRQKGHAMNAGDGRGFGFGHWWERTPKIPLVQVMHEPVNDYEYQVVIQKTGEVWVLLMCPLHHGIVSVRPHEAHRIMFEKDGTLSLSPSVVCNECGWHCYIFDGKVETLERLPESILTLRKKPDLKPGWAQHLPRTAPIAEDEKEDVCDGPSTSSSSMSPSAESNP